MPEAIRCFAVGYEDAISNAISIGGDSDTLAAITGSIAEGKWRVPVRIRRQAFVTLDAAQIDRSDEFKMNNICSES